MAARLADIFGVEAQPADGGAPAMEASDAVAETGTSTEPDRELETESVDLPLWPGGPRPAIVVQGASDRVGVMEKPGPEEAGLVGVMEKPGPEEAGLVGVMVRPKRAVAAAERITAAVPSAAAPGARPSRRRRADVSASEPAVGDATATDGRHGRAVVARRAAKPAKAPRKATPAVVAAAASCPYCAVLLQPPPSSSQRCAGCRQRIVVRRVDGRAVYLAEAAVPVFEAERRRIARVGPLTRERDRWLKLAATAGAPVARVERLTSAPLSATAVDGARTLYATTVERSFRAAKRERRWEDASRIRREQALATFRAAGSPTPVPSEIVGLHRDGVAAELRGIAEVAREAELVGASCCDACKADDGGIFRIATELRLRRLPHDGCPRGLCRCTWDLPAPYRTSMRRYFRRRTRADHRARHGEDPPTA